MPWTAKFKLHLIAEEKMESRNVKNEKVEVGNGFPWDKLRGFTWTNLGKRVWSKGLWLCHSEMFNNIIVSHWKAVPWRFCCVDASDCFVLFHLSYLLFMCGKSIWRNILYLHLYMFLMESNVLGRKWQGEIFNF